MRFFVIRMSNGEYLTKVRIVSNDSRLNTNLPQPRRSIPSQ